MAASLYGKVESALWSGSINFASDTIKAALVTSSYTPDFTAHDFFDDVTNEVTGTGYTAGGATLASKTVTFTAANSWGTSRANSTAYAVGDIVRPATGNTFLYQCVTAGTSGGSTPTYPTVVGQTVTDGGVTWSCVGRSILVIDCADPSWPSSTITARGVVIYKSTGTASTSPLIAYDTTGSDVSSTSGTFTYTVNAIGLIVRFVA
jgi:hypothetical protein